MKPPAWMEHGACVECDPDMFFDKARETETCTKCHPRRKRAKPK